MNTPHCLGRLLALPLVAAALATANVQAAPQIFADAVGDVNVDGNTTPGNGTLDIIKMEVSDTTNDIIFALTVNGNINTTDWGKFMIGIANMKTNGTTNGNGWGRPINLIASPTNGMTHWVGSWVDGGSGAELWTYNGAWSLSGATYNANFPGVFSSATNTNGSTISYTVSKASLGVALGDTIYFDAYSSGGGGGDSAVDALSKPTVSITSWGGPYTSGGSNPISQYTLANNASLITNTVTFSVDMNPMLSINAFSTNDFVTVAGSYNGFNSGLDFLTDADTNGVYEVTIPVEAPSGTSVAYLFYINGSAETSGNRTFPAGTDPNPAPLVLPTVFWNNWPGFRDVTFSVDMSIQAELGTFTNGNTVLVSGAFNNWDTTGGSNNVLTNGGGTNPIYTGTVPNIGGAESVNLAYKFYSPGMPNSGYESIDNRQLTLGPIGSNQVVPTAFWNNQTNIPQFRPVIFSVNMSVQATNGNFNTNTGVVRVIGDFNGQNYETGNTNYNLTNIGGNIYSGQFSVSGNAGTTNQYKFYTPDTPPMTNNGYEVVSTNLFENRTWVLGPSNVVQNLGVPFWSNDNGGESFTNWAQGAPLNPANLGLYAIGGATSPTAGNGVPSVNVLTSSNFSIIAIVRTNDPSLTVVGQTTTDLSTGPWITNGVTWSNTVDQSNVPAGCARQEFSIERTTNRQFLRIRSSLP